MKKTNGIWLAGVLAGAIIFGGTAYAASESENTAAAYLVERGVYAVGKDGDLNLDQSLTRADVAAIFTLMDFATPPGEIKDWRMWGEKRFSDPSHRYHPFTDIPDKALPYVEYCYELGYMRGVSPTLFDPQGLVNLKTVCTVLLRYCYVAENEYSFDTAADKARSLGLIPETGTDGGDTVSRGAMAEMTVRAMDYYAKLFPPRADPLIAAQPSPTPVPTPEPTLKDTYTREELEAMASEAVRLTNAERTNAGLPELRMLPGLMQSAQAKAEDFKENHYYGHQSAKYGNVLQMARAFGVQTAMAGENISIMDRTAEEVIAGWMASDGHRKNILNPGFTHIGVGLVRGKHGFSWVQQFTAAS
jgi:uncharacterized protein YkwD